MALRWVGARGRVSGVTTGAPCSDVRPTGRAVQVTGRGCSARKAGVTVMQKVTPFLWFDGQAERAARFYVSLFPDSQIDRVTRSPADTPSGPAGMVLTVEFTLSGTRFIALNGGPQFPFTEAVSFQIA